MRRALLLAVPVLLALPVPAARAGDTLSFGVTSLADFPDSNPGDGTCTSQDGHCTLRAAVEEATRKGQAVSITLPTGAIALATPLAVTTPVAVVGRAGSVLDASAGKAVAAVTMTSLSLSNLGIKGASTVDDTAGVLNATDSTITLKDVEIGGAHGGGALQVAGGSITLVGTSTHNCDGGEGAVLHAVHADVMITGSTFRANTATADGGALFLSYPSSLAISGSTFDGNTSMGSGGAVYLEGRGRGSKDLALSGTFTANEARTAGGAVLVRTTSDGISDAVLTLDRAAFTGNGSGTGGALAVDDGKVVVSGGTFSTNAARAGQGGAITAAGDLTVKDATFKGNTASEAGGAISSLGLVTVSGSTFSANTAGTAGGALALQGWGQPSVTSSPFNGNTASGEPQAIWRGGAGLSQSANSFATGQAVVVDLPARKAEKVSLTKPESHRQQLLLLGAVAGAMVLLLAVGLQLQRRKKVAA